MTNEEETSLDVDSKYTVNTKTVCSEMPEKPLVHIYSASIMSPGIMDM